MFELPPPSHSSIKHDLSWWNPSIFSNLIHRRLLTRRLSRYKTFHSSHSLDHRHRWGNQLGSCLADGVWTTKLSKTKSKKCWNHKLRTIYKKKSRKSPTDIFINLPQHKKPLHDPPGCLRESRGSYFRSTAATTHRRLPQQLRGALPRCGGHGAHAGAAKAAGLGGSRHLGKTCGAEEVNCLSIQGVSTRWWR